MKTISSVRKVALAVAVCGACVVLNPGSASATPVVEGVDCLFYQYGQHAWGASCTQANGDVHHVITMCQNEWAAYSIDSGTFGGIVGGAAYDVSGDCGEGTLTGTNWSTEST